MSLPIRVEYASQRKIRERNKLYYRFNHWPIWIFVFFIAPGPLTVRGDGLGSRRARPPAAREAVDERRGSRAAVLLRNRVGRVLGAAGAVGDVESAAADADERRIQARGVSGDPRPRGQPRAPRPPPTDAANRPGRA